MPDSRRENARATATVGGPLAGVLFFIGTLFPALGLFNVYPFIFSYVADHFQYLASLGIISLGSAGVVLLLSRWRLWRGPVAYGLCLGLLAVLACLTWRQCRRYGDMETLFRTTIAENPDCWMAHNNLGVVLIGRHQIDEAMAHYQRAIEIKSDYAEAHNNLGVILVDRNQTEDAIAHYRKAIESVPEFPGRLQQPGHSIDQEKTNHGGDCLLQQGPGNRPKLCGGPLQSGRGVSRS